MSPPAAASHSAWYGATITQFLSASPDEVLGVLAAASVFDMEVTQRDAWREEIVLLRAALSGVDGWLYLEFDVPRLGSRVDAVVVSGAAVIPIEFKIGADSFRRSDVEQAWDYGLDLKNFHEASHNACVFPLLVASAAEHGESVWTAAHADGVSSPVSRER